MLGGLSTDCFIQKPSLCRKRLGVCLLTDVGRCKEPIVPLVLGYGGKGCRAVLVVRMLAQASCGYWNLRKEVGIGWKKMQDG
jgi:hypothetical protein